MSNVSLEVCIDSVEGAIAATRGGADRLELCSALSEGGITPSYGLVQSVLEQTSLPVMMMIRPRGGSFVYSAEEVAVMLRDIELAKKLGVAGVVFGCLLCDGTLDLPTNETLVQTSRPLLVTFHRAFDEEPVDPFTTFDQLRDLEVDRLLTSGQQPGAAEGVELVRELVTRTEDLVVMPGAGVRPENAAEIIRATGATEIHGTASRFCDERKRKVTCEATVRAIREAIG